MNHSTVTPTPPTEDNIKPQSIYNDDLIDKVLLPTNQLSNPSKNVPEFKQEKSRIRDILEHNLKHYHSPHDTNLLQSSHNKELKMEGDIPQLNLHTSFFV